MPNFYNLLRARKFSTASDTAVEISAFNSATPNFTIDAGGKLSWSSGSATADTNLYRSAANTLKTDDSFDIASGKTYKIDGADVLTSTTLGSNVVNSSLTSLGTVQNLSAATPNFTGPTTVTGDLTVTGTLSIPANSISSTEIASSSVTSAKIGVLTNTTPKNDNYTLSFGDENTTILMDKATEIKAIIPANSTTAFAIGTQISFVQIGAGQLVFEGSAGVTLNSDNSKKKIMVRYGVASLIKTATDTWVLFGQLTA